MTTTNSETAARWTIDPVHSTVGFRIRHLMITNVFGTFDRVRGGAHYDPARPEASEIQVDLEAASVNTREPQRDAHLRSADFFDAEKHPVITFRSTGVRAEGAKPAEIHGELTMRGVARAVTLRVLELTDEHLDLQGKSRRGASAAATLKRSDFGIIFNKVLEAGGVALADEVSLTLDVSLVKDEAS